MGTKIVPYYCGLTIWQLFIENGWQLWHYSSVHNTGWMNECYKFFQNGPLFHKGLYQPQINMCQFFATSANVASLYKPKCYQWPQSASVMSLLSGFAAAVKYQVKMPRGIWTAPRQRNGQMQMAGQVGADVTRSPEPQEVCLAPGSGHHIESHRSASYSIYSPNSSTHATPVSWNQHA